MGITFGPWMVVAWKGRSRVEKAKELTWDSERDQREYCGKQSRFDVLASVDDEISNHGLNKESLDTKSIHMPTHEESNRPFPSNNKQKKTKSSTHFSNHTREDTSKHGLPMVHHPIASSSKHMHSPGFLHNKTKAHANHANHAHLLSNLPKPTVVPTKLNPTNHSAISFLPETNTINLHVGTNPGEPMLANPNMDDLGQLSKPIGDPPDGKFLVDQTDMEDDEEDVGEKLVF